MGIINYVRQKVNGTVRGAKSLGAKIALIGALTFSGCDAWDVFYSDLYNDIFNPSPYGNLTLEEVVAMMDTPRKAQNFINYEIDYAYGDLDGREIPLNWAQCQSFRRTFNRKKGVCRDGSIAVAAMLQDDNYPSYILDAEFELDTGKWDGHSVFVYQGENGKWGTAGINRSDFAHPVYDTIEDAARAVAGDFNEGYRGFRLHDLSLLDLIEGTNPDFVRKAPFRIRVEGPDYTLTGSVSKKGEGYEVSYEEESVNGDIIKTASYTKDVFDDYIYQEQWLDGSCESEPSSTFEWNVLQRAPCRLPIELQINVTGNHKNGLFEGTEHSDIVYNELKKKQNEELEVENYQNGVLTRYAKLFKTFYPNEITKTMTCHESIDGDREFDKIVNLTYDSEGKLVSEETEWLK